MEVNSCRLIDAEKKKKLMVMMEIAKLVVQMMILLKKPGVQTTVIRSRTTKQTTRKQRKGYEKGKDTKDKLLSQGDSHEEADGEHLARQTLQQHQTTRVVKAIVRFQTFCQATIH